MFAKYKLPKQMIVVDVLARHASGQGDYRLATEIAEEYIEANEQSD